jgi:hypothetical protein
MSSARPRPAPQADRERRKKLSSELQRHFLIPIQACNLALEKTEGYDHSRTEAWNNQIIVTPPSLPSKPAQHLLTPSRTTSSVRWCLSPPPPAPPALPGSSASTPRSSSTFLPRPLPAQARAPSWSMASRRQTPAKDGGECTPPAAPIGIRRRTVCGASSWIPRVWTW